MHIIILVTWHLLAVYNLRINLQKMWQEYKYCFFGAGIQVFSDSSKALRILNKLYNRFQVCTLPPNNKYEFRVTTTQKEHPYQLAIQSLGNQYYLYKTTQGIVISKKNTEINVEEFLLLDDKGYAHPTSYSETLNNLDKNRSENDQEAVFTYLQAILLQTISTLIPQYHLLHAAALSWNNKGIILGGESSKGKTSLTLALVKHGFKFLSDDITCVEPKTSCLRPFPRSLNLRSQGFHRLQDLLNVKEIHSPIDIEEIFPGSVGNPCILYYVLLLKGFGGEPKLELIPNYQALQQVLPLLRSRLDKHTKTIWQLTPLFNQVHCYELTVGDLDTTASLIYNSFYESRQENSN